MRLSSEVEKILLNVEFFNELLQKGNIHQTPEEDFAWRF